MMEKHVKEIFADYEYLLKKFKKNDYIKNMELFRNKWNDILSQTVLNGSYENCCSEFVDQFFVY